ncbi:hypothetical protein [uncultured Thiodictyon sp.]|uniref:InlB B-repeat-containing protein n=1 Tax=uncultured Thiodictyon sp. TaxID=1846217 RepID=UPI0025D6B9AC|nr:hypothetical protein [uncultured Thiodictyon sp.]
MTAFAVLVGMAGSILWPDARLLLAAQGYGSYGYSYLITATAEPPAGGAVSCLPTAVASGGTSTCTATTNSGYVFAGWRGDCAGQGGTTCTLSNITSAKAVVANYVDMALVVPSRGGWRPVLGR